MSAPDMALDPPHKPAAAETVTAARAMLVEALDYLDACGIAVLIAAVVAWRIG